jgi:hypothetical protein
MNSDDQQKAASVARALSRQGYIHLRNTVRVLRGSQALLDPEQEKKVREFEAVVAAYQEEHPC